MLFIYYKNKPRPNKIGRGMFYTAVPPKFRHMPTLKRSVTGSPCFATHAYAFTKQARKGNANVNPTVAYSQGDFL